MITCRYQGHLHQLEPRPQAVSSVVIKREGLVLDEELGLGSILSSQTIGSNMSGGSLKKHLNDEEDRSP